MKKNNIMRAGAALGVLSLATSCFAGGTFAKYVTSGSGTDSARVAKWGVTVAAENADIFNTSYGSNNTTITTNTVISSDKVVAPGTSGNIGGFTVSGTPEVAGIITREATVDLTNWMIDLDGEGANPAELYFPLTITVNGNPVPFTDCTTIDDYEDAIETAINNSEGYSFTPETNLSEINDDDLSVTWEWPFEDNDDNDKDKKDTLLGDAAAADNASTISISIETKVTQLD